MKHITIFLLLLIICLSAFSQADPVAPSQTTTNTTTIESSKIPDLIEFFQSYTIPTNALKNSHSSLLITPHSSFLTPHSTFHIPHSTLSLDSLPDSLYIVCADYHPITTSQRITSQFGIRGARFHFGIDIGVPYGDTIRSPFSGYVRLASYQRGGYGRYVIITHDNGLESVMAHFSRTLVREGQQVIAGQPIGLAGSTGRSTGSHLHLEFRLFGNQFNPEKLIDFNTFSINTQDDGYYFMTKANTYSHRPQLEEMKRAAYHRVRSGETLSHIARRYGTTVSRLCSLNRIKPTSILQIGQKIRYR